MWRERNPNVRPNITANTFKTQRLNIERTLPEEQREAVKSRVNATV